MSHASHAHDHNYLLRDDKIRKNERKTMLVVLLTFVTMIIEIFYGYVTGSMALLADGWHMASHVGALGISVVAYRLARSEKLSAKFSFGTGKFVPLGGYTSAIMLGLVAIFMIVESFERFLNPVSISYDSALAVAVVGFIVNLVSAFILWDSHDHHHAGDHTHDHNLKSAFTHVLADALTSVAAIVALALGKAYGWTWADPLMGIVGSIVILKWGYNLCKATVWELLDGHSKSIRPERIRKIFEDLDNVEITDLHIWRIAPNAHACEMVVYNQSPKGTEFYRDKIQSQYLIEHLIVEERTCQH